MSAPRWPSASHLATVAPADWRDWTRQMQHRVRSAADLAAWIQPSEDELTGGEPAVPDAAVEEFRALGFTGGQATFDARVEVQAAR